MREKKKNEKKREEEEASVFLRSPDFLSPISTVRSCDGPSGGVETGLADCYGCFRTSEEASAPADPRPPSPPPPPTGPQRRWISSMFSSSVTHLRPVWLQHQVQARLRLKSPGLGGQTWVGMRGWRGGGEGLARGRRGVTRRNSLHCSPAHQGVCLSQ